MLPQAQAMEQHGTAQPSLRESITGSNTKLAQAAMSHRDDDEDAAHILEEWDRYRAAEAGGSTQHAGGRRRSVLHNDVGAVALTPQPAQRRSGQGASASGMPFTKCHTFLLSSNPGVSWVMVDYVDYVADSWFCKKPFGWDCLGRGLSTRPPPPPQMAYWTHCLSL